MKNTRLIKISSYRILSALLAFALIMLFLPVNKVNAGNPSLYFSPASLTANVGTIYSVKIMINTDGDETDGVTADLSYPSETLELVSVSSANSVFPSQAEEDSSTPGTVKISRFITGTTYNGTGEVTTLNFKPLREGTHAVAFTSNAKITFSGADILDTVGTLTITASAATGGAGGEELPNTALTDSPVFIGFGILLVMVGLYIPIHKKLHDDQEPRKFNRDYIDP